MDIPFLICKKCVADDYSQVRVSPARNEAK